jgi:hypothetical protein
MCKCNNHDITHKTHSEHKFCLFFLLMSPNLEFNNYSDSAVSLKYGDINIGFLSSVRWQMAYKALEDANKESLKRFLADQTTNLNIIIQGSGTNCLITIAENRFKIHINDTCANFTISNSLSCQFSDNKAEIMKFVNYLYQQFEANVN